MASRSDSLPLAPSRTTRSRLPQALLAALLIVGGGLGGLLLFSRYDQRVPAVVVARPVTHGQVVERGDLAVAEVAVGSEVALVGSISEAAGLVAAHDLQPGELLTAGDVATADRLVTDSESVIGLLLEPGGYPTIALTAGDRVDVYVPTEGPVPTSAPLATDLVVFDVIESSSDGRTLLVSLVVDPEQAGPILDAVAQDGVRLALRGEPES